VPTICPDHCLMVDTLRFAHPTAVLRRLGKAR
jgi:hypothetical protein